MEQQLRYYGEFFFEAPVTIYHTVCLFVVRPSASLFSKTFTLVHLLYFMLFQLQAARIQFTSILDQTKLLITS